LYFKNIDLLLNIFSNILFLISIGPIIWPIVFERIKTRAGVRTIPKISIFVPYLFPIIGSKEIAGVVTIGRYMSIKNGYFCSFEKF